jgi:hypothetical protein
MTSHSTTPCLPQSEIETTAQLFDNFDRIEAGLRDRARAELCSPIRVIRRTSADVEAEATYRAAIQRWPAARITLRQGDPGGA